MQAKKDPTLRTLEARLRNARYLGELVKFRLAPIGTIFVMLKVRFLADVAIHVLPLPASVLPILASDNTIDQLKANVALSEDVIYDSHQHQGSHCAMLQSLLDDFVQHNVDTACGLLETAGRFLYRLPETHTRMANMAEVCTLLGYFAAFTGSKADSCARHCR